MVCKGRLGRACEAGARGCLSIPLSVILESCYIHVVAPGFRSPTHRWIKLTSTEKGNQRACERVKRGQNSERGRRPGSTASPVFPSICVCCLAFYGNTLWALFDPRIGHLTSFDLSLGNTRARGAGDEDGRAGEASQIPSEKSHGMVERRRDGAVGVRRGGISWRG